MKRFLPILLLVFLLAFTFGCKKDGKEKSASDVEASLNATVEEYAKANSVSAKITLTSDSNEVIDVKYNIENGKIKSLATVLTDSVGEVSVYVKDGVCYVARYNAPKEKYSPSDAELTSIASDYTLDKYIKKALDVFNKQFFAASSMTKVADGEYKFTCDLASLAVADDIPDDEVLEAEAQIEKLKAMDSIDLTLKLNGDKVKEFVGTFVKEGKTSTIKIEFLSLDAVTIDVPSASEYTEKTK